MPCRLLPHMVYYVATSLFRRPLTELQVPVLFLGSLEDEMCRDNLEEEYEAEMQTEKERKDKQKAKCCA